MEGTRPLLLELQAINSRNSISSTKKEQQMEWIITD